MNVGDNYNRPKVCHSSDARVTKDWDDCRCVNRSNQLQLSHSCEATLVCGNAHMLVRSWQEEAIRYVPTISQEIRVKIWSFVEEIEERNSLSGKFRRARMV